MPYSLIRSCPTLADYGSRQNAPIYLSLLWTGYSAKDLGSDTLGEVDGSLSNASSSGVDQYFLPLHESPSIYQAIYDGRVDAGQACGDLIAQGIRNVDNNILIDTTEGMEASCAFKSTHIYHPITHFEVPHLGANSRDDT
jgi:hypothetical protein